jgi:LruC domain-containing protein
VLLLTCTQPFSDFNPGGKNSDTNQPGSGVLPSNTVDYTARIRPAVFDFATVFQVDVDLVIHTYRQDEDTGEMIPFDPDMEDNSIFYTIYDASSSVVVAGVTDGDGKAQTTITVSALEPYIRITASGQGFTASEVTVNNPAEKQRVSAELHIAEAAGGLSARSSVSSSQVSSYSVPSNGVYTIAYEDNFPSVGDADYNDFIARFNFQLTNDARGRLTKLEGWVTAKARAAGYDHRFGFVVNMAGLKGNLTVQNYDPAAPNTPIPVVTSSPVQDTVNVVVFDYTKQAFRRQTGSVTIDNGYPDRPLSEGFSAYFVIENISAVSFAPNPWFADAAPFDPYLYIHNTEFDVHLIGKPPLEGSNNPSYTDAWEFRDEAGFPRALLVPNDWAHPIELNHIENAYARFRNWRESGGIIDQDWYLYPEAGEVFQLP